MEIEFTKLTTKDAARYILDETETVFFKNDEGKIFQLTNLKEFTEAVANEYKMYRQNITKWFDQ